MQIARAKAEKKYKSQNYEKYKTPHKSVSELIWRGGGFGAAAPLDKGVNEEANPKKI